MTDTRTDITPVIERVRALLAALTKGPYDAGHHGDLIRALRGEMAVPLFEARGVWGDPDLPAPGLKGEERRWIYKANSHDARHSAAEQQRVRNGRALAELLNTLPTLFDAIEARGAQESDVTRLVIAAREFWEANGLNDTEEGRALDQALERFASRVPYENEPAIEARGEQGSIPFREWLAFQLEVERNTSGSGLTVAQKLIDVLERYDQSEGPAEAHPDRTADEANLPKPWDRNAARTILREKLEPVHGDQADDVRSFIDAREIAEEHDPDGIVHAIIDAMIDFAAQTSVEEIRQVLAEKDRAIEAALQARHGDVGAAVAAERERCALIAEGYYPRAYFSGSPKVKAGNEIAAAIRQPPASEPTEGDR